MASLAQDVSRAVRIVPTDKSVLSLMEKIRADVIAAGVDALQIENELPEAARLWVSPQLFSSVPLVCERVCK